MTAADVRERAAAARKFLEVADLVMDEDMGSEQARVVGSLAALAGVAASDAVCGRVLRLRPQGQDHGQAVQVLETIAGAGDLASALRRLLREKSNAEYGTTAMSPDRARQMLRQARTMVEGMELLIT